MPKVLVLAIASIALLGASKAPAARSAGAKASRGAIYCLRGAHHALSYLVAKPRPDGRLAFGVSNWLPNGHLAGAQGIAEREGDHWTYTAPRDPADGDRPYPTCTVRIWLSPGGGARVEADKAAPCPGGYGAELGAVTFPRRAYFGRVTHELDFLEGVKDAPTLEEQPGLCEVG